MAKKTAKKPASRLLIISAAMIVVTVFIGVVFIYMPFANKSKSLREEILRERDRNVLIGKIRAMGRHLKVYNKRVPQGRGVSWLISHISDIASKQKIEISSIKPGIPEDRGLYTNLHVVLDIACTYNQLGEFISKIESSEKFLRVESINMKRLDLGKEFDEEAEKFKAFDIKAHLVISTVVLKE